MNERTSEAVVQLLEQVAWTNLHSKGVLGREVREMSSSILHRVARSHGVEVDDAGKLRCPDGEFTNVFGSNCVIPDGPDYTGIAQRALEFLDGLRSQSNWRALLGRTKFADDGDDQVLRLRRESLVQLGHRLRSDMRGDGWISSPEHAIDAAVPSVAAGLLGEPAMMVDATLLELILRDGRIKNQFETGTSNGALDHEARRDAERRFGVDPYEMAAIRPVYGYSNIEEYHGPTPGRGSSEESYGNVRLVFKPSILDRTTVSFGDSLYSGFALNYQDIINGNVTADDIYSSSTRSFATNIIGAAARSIHGDEEAMPSAIGTFDEELRYSYVEFQYHGGVSLFDIERVTFPESDFNEDSRGWRSADDEDLKRIALSLNQLGIQHNIPNRLWETDATETPRGIPEYGITFDELAPYDYSSAAMRLFAGGPVDDTHPDLRIVKHGVSLASGEDLSSRIHRIPRAYRVETAADSVNMEVGDVIDIPLTSVALDIDSARKYETFGIDSPDGEFRSRGEWFELVDFPAVPFSHDGQREHATGGKFIVESTEEFKPDWETSGEPHFGPLDGKRRITRLRYIAPVDSSQTEPFVFEPERNIDELSIEDMSIDELAYAAARSINGINYMEALDRIKGMNRERGGSEAAYKELVNSFVLELGRQRASIRRKSSKPAPSSAPTFADLQRMTKIDGPLGSHGGQWYRDSDGTEWFAKPTISRDHAQNEVAMGIVYEMAGVPFPVTGFTEDDNGQYHVVSRKVPEVRTASASEWESSSELQERAAQDFGIDAWLSHWDVHGAVADNTLVTADGAPQRIESGGAGKYRARGEVRESWKVGPWIEPESMRTSEQGRLMYGEMTDAQVAESLSRILDVDTAAIEQRWLQAGVNPDDAAEWRAVLDHRKSLVPGIISKLEGRMASRSPEVSDATDAIAQRRERRSRHLRAMISDMQTRFTRPSPEQQAMLDAIKKRSKRGRFAKLEDYSQSLDQLSDEDIDEIYEELFPSRSLGDSGVRASRTSAAPTKAPSLDAEDRPSKSEAAALIDELPPENLKTARTRLSLEIVGNRKLKEKIDTIAFVTKKQKEFDDAKDDDERREILKSMLEVDPDSDVGILSQAGFHVLSFFRRSSEVRPSKTRKASEAFSFARDDLESYNPMMSSVLSHMDSLHEFPEFDNIAKPRIEFGNEELDGGVHGEFRPSKSPPSMGEILRRTTTYTPTIRVAGGKAVEQLRIAQEERWSNNDIQRLEVLARREQAQQAITLAHEIGHSLDFIGGELDDKDFYTGRTSSAALALMTAWEDSYARTIAANSSWNDDTFMEYLDSPPEVWARAYAQWVVHRMPEGREKDLMLDELDRYANLGTAWDSMENDMIVELVEDILVERGLL